MKLRTILAAVSIVTAIAGCALAIGLPDRSGTFCARESYALCEDFDNPGARFNFSLTAGRPEPGYEAVVVNRGKSLPNAFLAVSPAVPADANIAAPFIHIFNRGPDGLVVGFSFFLESVNLMGVAGPPENDAGTDLVGGSLILGLVQWEAGLVMIILRGGDELYLLRTARINDSPALGRSTPINARNKSSLRGVWTDIEFRIDLGTSTVTLTKSPDGLVTGDIPAESKLNAKTTQTLFGPISIGPSGANSVLIDNLYANFP